MGKIFRAAPERSGADAYGWTHEHLQALIGDEAATDAMCTVLSHMLGGRLADETLEDMSLVKVTPLLKGSKGKVRPITVGSTLIRIGLSAMLKAEPGLTKAVGPTELAIGRKSAIEDLKRGIDAATH